MDSRVNGVVRAESQRQGDGIRARSGLRTRGAAAVWIIAALSGGLPVARAADYAWHGMSGGAWNSAANWNALDYPRLAGDTASFTQDFTAAYSVTLNSGVTVDALRVTDTNTATAFGLTLNAGAPTLTLNGAAPELLSGLASGQWLTVNPVVILNTANARLSKLGVANVYLPNPGAAFFSNLNPTGGLNVSAGTLRIGNVDVTPAPLATLKTGAGALQLDLANGSAFFRGQPDLGGTGTRTITNVRSVADAASNPQTLTNSSPDRLELWLDPASTATFFSSLNGISSVGTAVLNNFTGAVDLAGKSFNIGAYKLILSGNGGGAGNAVLNGGSFSTGTGSLVLGEGVTLNVDSRTGLFDIQDMEITSRHTSNPYSGGDATVNWNANGKNIRGSLMIAEQGGTHATFNMLGGTLSPNVIRLGNSSHNYDDSESMLNVSGGTLSSSGNYLCSMSRVTTGGAMARSTVTVSASGVLDLMHASEVRVGERSAVHATEATVSDVTINLDGGTLILGKPIARQNVAATTNAGSSATVQFYFNGGTLQAGANLAQVFSNFGTTNSDNDGVFVKAGGAVIDCNGFNVGITNSLLDASGGTGGGLTKYGGGTLTLFGTNTYVGDTTVNTTNGLSGTGLLKLGASEVIPHGTGKGNLILNAGAAVDLNGFSETINGLSSAAANALVTNSSPAASVLTVGANGAGGFYAGGLGGALSLVKTGEGTLTLASPCPYTGATAVAGGTLVLEAACTLRSASVAVQRGAALSLAAAGVFGGSGSRTRLFVGKEDVTQGPQGKIAIPAGVEVSVLHFAVNGLYRKAGAWGATGSGAAFVDDAVFTGGGVLRVLATGPKRGMTVKLSGN